MRAGNLFSNKSCECPPNVGTPQGACIPPGYPTFKRGQLPIVQAFCIGDTVTQPGRINAAWVPEFVVEEFFARGAAYAPRAPLSDTDTYTTAPITLTLAPSAGEAVLTPGFIVDLMTSNNVAPGITTFTVTAAFEGMAAASYVQTVQLSTSRVGLSRFVILGTKEVQGGAYPSLISIANAAIVGVDGDLANVIYTRTFSVSLESVPGTSVRIETLSPISELWYQAMSAWYSTAQPYNPSRL
jgi:hypothetical protein